MPEASGRPSRRRFLDWIIGTAGFAWLASIAYPVIRYLGPLPSRGAGGPVEVPADKLAEAKGPKHFAIVRAAGTRIIVLQGPDAKLHALSAVCTHEGCTVQWKAGEQLIWCACHNGKFGLDGDVISGPPPRPLPVYGVAEDASGKVEVKVEAS